MTLKMEFDFTPDPLHVADCLDGMATNEMAQALDILVARLAMGGWFRAEQQAKFLADSMQGHDYRNLRLWLKTVVDFAEETAAAKVRP